MSSPSLKSKKEINAKKMHSIVNIFNDNYMQDKYIAEKLYKEGKITKKQYFFILKKVALFSQQQTKRIQNTRIINQMILSGKCHNSVKARMKNPPLELQNILLKICA